MTVAEIQRALLARGYDLGPAGVDGDAGPKTIAAVTAFQRAAGLVADGIAGPLTQKALGSVDVTEKKAEPDQPAWLTLAGDEVGTVGRHRQVEQPEGDPLLRGRWLLGHQRRCCCLVRCSGGGDAPPRGRKPSGSLAARSYESWGVGLKAPILGCIRQKKRGNSSWQGHVFFVVAPNKDTVFGLGGNPERCGDRPRRSSAPRSPPTAGPLMSRSRPRPRSPPPSQGRAPACRKPDERRSPPDLAARASQGQPAASPVRYPENPSPWARLGRAIWAYLSRRR